MTCSSHLAQPKMSYKLREDVIVALGSPWPPSGRDCHDITYHTDTEESRSHTLQEFNGKHTWKNVKVIRKTQHGMGSLNRVQESGLNLYHCKKKKLYRCEPQRRRLSRKKWGDSFRRGRERGSRLHNLCTLGPSEYKKYTQIMRIQ